MFPCGFTPLAWTYINDKGCWAEWTSTSSSRNVQNNKGIFTRLANGLRKAIETKALSQRVSARFEKLSESWNTVQEKHGSYVNNLSDQSTTDDEEEWIATLQAKFENLELEVDAHIETETTEERRFFAEAAENQSGDEEKSRQNAEKELAAKVEKLVIKMCQEEKKFDTLSETLQTIVNDAG